MEPIKRVLISGASIAGLSMAYWMKCFGYHVTVVEVASAPRMGGTAVNLRNEVVDILKRMGIFEQVQSEALHLETIEFKNAADVTEGSMSPADGIGGTGGAGGADGIGGASGPGGVGGAAEEVEIERSSLVRILLYQLKEDVVFLFNDSIIALHESADHINVVFRSAPQQAFDLVFGCDGAHSGVRRIWFGDESEYIHFLDAYFSISIVEKLLIPPNTMQFYNVPGKAYMLNAYKNKTDIIFCFLAENEIAYDYRDVAQQREIILSQFMGQGWRTAELLEEVAQSENFYFDKFCQIKMPSWTKGRVALVGDAAYCASPAAGIGGSLAMEGSAALADALQRCDGNFSLAFQEYNRDFRPFIEGVQAEAEFNVKENFILKTEEAIRKRNKEGF